VKSFLFGLFLMGCDMAVDVHDNPISLNIDACAVLNPALDSCQEPQQSFDVPRAENEPCDDGQACGDDLFCACGVCLNMEDFQ